MADLQTSLERARGVLLVTFVGDPALGRPGALEEYAREYGARPGRWLLLTGAPAIAGDRYFVIDASGRIRGAFPAGDPVLSAEILGTVGALMRESGAPPGVAGRQRFR